jgi:hypothetical protein
MRQTRINGIPANLLAPTPETIENHNNREKWDSANPVGDVAEGLAALERIQPKRSRIERRTAAQKAVVRAKSSLNTIQAWMETTARLTEAQVSYLEDLEKTISDACHRLERGTPIEAVLPTLPQPKQDLPDFLTRRSERQLSTADLDWRDKAPLVGQKKPEPLEALRSHSFAAHRT